jgi:hypothetical protein
MGQHFNFTCRLCGTRFKTLLDNSQIYQLINLFATTHVQSSCQHLPQLCIPRGQIYQKCNLQVWEFLSWKYLKKTYRLLEKPPNSSLILFLLSAILRKRLKFYLCTCFFLGKLLRLSIKTCKNGAKWVHFGTKCNPFTDCSSLLAFLSLFFAQLNKSWFFWIFYIFYLNWKDIITLFMCQNALNIQNNITHSIWISYYKTISFVDMTWGLK